DRVALDVHAEDGPGVGPHLVSVAGQLDATGLAAPAHLDLGLDHHRVADALGGGDGVVDGGDGLAGADRDAVAGEELLALVFVQVQGRDSWWRGREGRFVGHGAGWRYYGRGRDPSQVRPMSPVAQTRSPAGRARVIAGAGGGPPIAIAFGVAELASRGKVEVRLGSETFSQYDAKQ